MICNYTSSAFRISQQDVISERQYVPSMIRISRKKNTLPSPVFLCSLVLLAGFLFGCRTSEPEISVEFAPELMSILRIERHSLIQFLRHNVSTDPTRELVFRMITHPTMGQTFFVNIETDREIIILHPVKERYEKIVFYDPRNHASSNVEVGSNFIQSRCANCRNNRFELGVAFSFNPAIITQYESFTLGGKCSECGAETILYSTR